MKYQENALLVEKKVLKNYILLTIKTKYIAKNSKPGQFVNVRVTSRYDPLLRRPFSICDVEGDLLKLLIQVKGKGTEILFSKEPGEMLNIIGPLGNGFPLNVKNPLFVAGGIGIAPFPFLSKFFKKSILLYGVRTNEYMIDQKLFPPGVELFFASEDGSVGEKGTVIDLLVKYGFEDYSIYACGPKSMFHALSRLFKNCSKEIEAYYSLESYMACGFGACKGCVVNTTNGYKLVCKDGPVFFWREVLL